MKPLNPDPICHSPGSVPRALRAGRGFASTLVLLAAWSGCARSEQDIQQEFDDVVAGANECSAAADCVLVDPGCPLGCFVAVNASHKDEVEQKARELIDAYERGGQSCAYECIAPGPVACTGGRCEVEPTP